MSSSIKKFKSINHKLVLMIILASTCITAVATLFNIYIDFRNEKEIQNLTLEQIERSSLSSITEAVWQLDDRQLENNIKGIFDIHDVIGLQIIDENGNIVFDKQKESSENINKFKFEKVYKLEYKTNLKIEQLGYIKVVVTNYHLYIRLLKKILFFFFTQGLKTFIISFIMLSIFSYYVTRHLNSLVAHLLSQTVTEQKKLRPFYFNREQSDHEDEFDILSRNYNELAQVVNQRYEEQQIEYELILNSAGEGIFCLDLDGKISYINESGAAIIKSSPQKIVGTPVTRVLNASGIESVNHKVLDRLQEGQGNIPRSFELNFRRSDGSIIPVECTSTLILGRDGEERGSVIVYKDISEQKEVQDQLIKSKELAEQALKTKARFLANMSHEIRTPLNGIIGFADLLLESDLKPDDKENVKVIHECGQSLLVIINDILDYSRLEYGALKLSHTKINIAKFISSSMNMFKKEVADRGIQLVWQIDKNVPADIYSDPDRIRQILINIVNNAIKFTKLGSVQLSVSSTKLPDQQCKLLFTVKDTGIGIPKEKVAHLFQRFTQADDSTTRKYGGTGLGLAISKSLVELFEGEIWVESEENVGSTFYFSLVVDAAPVQERPAELLG